MSGKNTLSKVHDKKIRIGIVRALWHDKLTRALMDDAVQALHVCGVTKRNITIMEVPGSYELVYGAKVLVQSKCDAVVALGVLVKGDTMHFEYIAEAVANGLMRLNIDSGTPVLFGVLTCLTQKQAEERSVGKKNHGYNWGLSAVHMARIKKYGTRHGVSA